jgi:quercetin dioxygenase-like cupin family protein
MTGAKYPRSDKRSAVRPQVRETQAIKPPVAASRYLAAGKAEWQPTEYPGFWIKPLYEDIQAGEKTLLMKVDPGAFASRHSHDEFEQFYVLKGSLFDDVHELRAGDYCCRTIGTPHTAGSHDGAIVLLIYTRLRPSSVPTAPSSE